nr:DUF969 domain-containing protein [Kineococcus aurantiacus]
MPREVRSSTCSRANRWCCTVRCSLSRVRRAALIAVRAQYRGRSSTRSRTRSRGPVGSGPRARVTAASQSPAPCSRTTARSPGSEVAARSAASNAAGNRSNPEALRTCCATGAPPGTAGVARRDSSTVRGAGRGGAGCGAVTVTSGAGEGSGVAPGNCSDRTPCAIVQRSLPSPETLDLPSVLAKGAEVLVLLGILVVVAGFALRLNPMLVVTVAGLVTGFLGGMSPVEVLDAFGTGFAGSRSVSIFLLVLPVIGLVERNGLQEQARRLVSRMSRLTTGGILAGYFVLRQVTAAIGLMSIGGHAQTVRPLVAPMAEAAAVRRFGTLPDAVSQRIRAFAASTDNVGAFFGEDIFVAVGAVLLITSFVDTTYGYTLEPLQVALWAIPTAVVALLIHGARSLHTDRALTKAIAEFQPTEVAR